MEDGAVKVITPTEDTPAFRAGIKAGDFITHLDGKLIYGGTLDEAVDKMRGAPGTAVRLTIVRPGRDKPFDVTLTREIIQLKPVKWEVKNRVGIININTFNKKTGEAVRAALTGIDKAVGGQPLGYVVDLRSNPGGLLDQAIEVGDAFLDRGEIVSQRGREKNDIERYYARPGDHRARPADGRAGRCRLGLGGRDRRRRAAGSAARDRDGREELRQGIGADAAAAERGYRAAPHHRALLTRRRAARCRKAGSCPTSSCRSCPIPITRTSPRLREADLRRHLINEAKVDDSVLEDDGKPDPRFSATADALKKQGVEDFQLDYALKTIARLGEPAPPRCRRRRAPAMPALSRRTRSERIELAASRR